MNSDYESATMLDQYLLFHYGSPHDQQPFDFGPAGVALQFPTRCVSECLDLSTLPQAARGLDLGCAVGRSSFELSRYCQYVLGIDKSKNFIQAAKSIQKQGILEYSLLEEGGRQSKRNAYLPEGIHPSRVEFQCLDVMDLAPTSTYHVVLAANLICRLADPEAFLKKIPSFIASSGQLILVSPYSWLEEYTSSSKWLKGESGLDGLKKILNPHFHFKRAFDMPFLIREHLRKYQWCVAEASLWIRK
jgi:putative 4-mercaptohistidine N1-methyltranferase